MAMVACGSVGPPRRSDPGTTWTDATTAAIGLQECPHDIVLRIEYLQDPRPRSTPGGLASPNTDRLQSASHHRSPGRRQREAVAEQRRAGDGTAGGSRTLLRGVDRMVGGA